MAINESHQNEFIRASELPTRFACLGRSTWNLLLRRGALRSRKLGRARIVSVADVEAFLAARPDEH